MQQLAAEQKLRDQKFLEEIKRTKNMSSHPVLSLEPMQNLQVNLGSSVQSPQQMN